MPCKAILVLLAALAGSILARPPDVTFLCNEMPEICTNMCWAIRCANPTFPQSFALDPSGYGTSPQNKSTISSDCRINSLCGNLHGLNKTGHRDHPYDACNAYPFSVTVAGAAFPPAHQAHRVSRCVPEEEQCKQRIQLELLSKRLQQQSAGQQGVRQLSINFGNPGGIKFCNNDPCVNDGFQVQDGALGRRSEPPMFKYYRTRSGIILASLEEIEMPSIFTRRVGSGELVPPGFHTWFERAHEETVYMMQDAIMQRLSAHSFVV
ncbi:deoxyribonuclease nuca nucb domain-containing [Trichoderma cornu-damae]|uniref:Deoxyribonuclease nuca nucb domain-containing n=1 Tax=Trichoderma cornu-damae TaxID=654480 RepID=A0A9P8QTA7_9HYPO|nr:deoxyribonuclease nuca nucb domain-containing [Trichoderma cornu-damae]